MKLFGLLTLIAVTVAGNQASWEHASTAGYFARQIRQLAVDTNKIYNGDRAKLIPFMVSLQLRGAGITSFRHFCGATRITSYQLLTAAHCFSQSISASPQIRYRAVLGTNSLNGTNGVRISFVYSNVTLHPQYDTSMLANDYAIISLPRSIGTSSTLRTVRLADGTVPKNSPVGGLGWGVYNCQNLSPYLRYALGHTLSDFECKYWLLNLNVPPFNNNRVCASFNTTSGTGSGVDSGDSGGPLVAAGGNELIQIGIASFIAPRNDSSGNTCVDTSKPQFFASTAAGRSFVLSVAPTAQFTTVT